MLQTIPHKDALVPELHVRDTTGVVLHVPTHFLTFPLIGSMEGMPSGIWI
jgi:hypothetical protein